jgi:hypothetical protein
MLCGTTLVFTGCPDPPADETEPEPARVEKADEQVPADEPPPAEKKVEEPPGIDEEAEAEESELIDVYGPPRP